MTLHDRIVRLRDVVRRVADAPNIDEARKMADEELARPMPEWQTLTTDDLDAIKKKWVITPRPMWLLVEDMLRRKNGF